MNWKLLAGAVGLMTFATQPAIAATQAGARVFTTIGNYSVDVGQSNDETALAAGLGFAFGIDSFFGDVSLELVDLSSFRKTDAQLSAGYRFTDHWSVFGGIRYGMQSTQLENESEEFFDDNFYSEIGPFLGVGFGGLSLGEKAVASFSLAYAYNELSPNEDTFPNVDGDSSGFSAKIGLGFRGSPHSLSVRFQRFDGEFDFPGGSTLDYTETYLYLTYQVMFWRGRF